MARAVGCRDRGAGRSRAAAVQAVGNAAMLGLLALAAMSPAAGQPIPPAAGPSIPSDRDTCLQRVDAEMDGWRMKLHGMREKAVATVQETATAAEADLRSAWDQTKADAGVLRTATAAGWEDAKSSFERASQNLSRAWDKTRL